MDYLLVEEGAVAYGWLSYRTWAGVYGGKGWDSIGTMAAVSYHSLPWRLSENEIMRCFMIYDRVIASCFSPSLET